MLYHVLCFQVLCLYLFALLESVISQDISITSTMDQEFACPGHPITFTCVTRGSLSITWQSYEYIEDIGTRIRFNTHTYPGSTEGSHVYPSTIATFINLTSENGVNILTSQLRIEASADFSIGTVKCIHGDGRINSSMVRVFGM